MTKPKKVQATCPLCGHVFETAELPNRCDRCGGELRPTKKG